MNLKPEVLRHPNIPKPLHGLSPRAVKGKEWWDVTRKEVYAKQGYRCIACGVHKRDAKYHNWIEAHESYTIDYSVGCMEVKEIVGLCHSCHGFIHCGRLQMIWHKGEISSSKYFDVMQHGFRVLRGANLKPNAVQAVSYCSSLEMAGKAVPDELGKAAMKIQDLEEIEYIQQDWTKWHMILEGQKYYSKFRNQREWEDYYE